MKKQLIGSILCLIFLTAFVHAQPQTVRGGTIAFDVDVARFQASDGWTYVEIYYSIPRTALEYKAVDDKYKAQFELGANIIYADSVVAQKSQQNIDIADSLEAIVDGQFFYNMFSFYLKEGSYKVRARVTDLMQQKGGWFEYNLDIPAYSDTALGVSDIQIATNLYPDTMKTLFTKNGFRILPNPKCMYGIELPMLFYYAEIYNLSDLSTSSDSSYTVYGTVRDSNGKVVKSLPSKKRYRSGSSVVEVGRLNVATLTSGTYQFVLDITDGGTQDTIHQAKHFFVYRQADFLASGENSPVPESQALNEFAAMDEKELEQHFEYCNYIATREEKKMFKKLDLKGKQEFMNNFWHRRDTNPETAFNEYKQEYYQRISVANQRFSGTFQNGWKTDMGLIYIKYGEPNEIERYPSSMDEKAHEIWYYYELEGGVEFVFVDIRNLGSMQLVHSTARNELQDYDWERWLN